MTTPSTYAELQAAAIQWLIRDDLDAMVTQFISLAEQHFNRVLRVPEMEAVSTTTANSTPITLPSDFLEMRSLYVAEVAGTSPSIALDPVTPRQLGQMFPQALTGYPPANYALQSGNQLILAPTPDADTESTLVINYYAKIPELTVAEPTNWLLAAHGDLYLAATLVEGFMFIRDSEAMAFWSARRDQKLSELRTQGIRKAYSGPLRARAQPLWTAHSNL